MRIFFLSFVLSLCSIESFAQYASSSNSQKKGGDYIESTSYNDTKRGKPRILQYLPEGNDFVCVNGENRYTRALYGSHTAWRLEKLELGQNLGMGFPNGGNECCKIKSTRKGC